MPSRDQTVQAPDGPAPGGPAIEAAGPASADAVSPATWLGRLPDETPLCDINLPGTHDSGAINTRIPTEPYACQDRTITQQLEGGIRLLDIRLKAKPVDGGYGIVICHGYWSLGLDLNEFSTFAPVLKQCVGFLTANPSEAIVMILKFDDGWPDKDITAQDTVLKALRTLMFEEYPGRFLKDANSIPTLGSARGKIVLFNRINTDVTYGAPIGWKENEPGAYTRRYGKSGLPFRLYEVYVQDHYSDVWEYKKLREIWAAAVLKQDKQEIFLNFVSATHGGGLFGLYVSEGLLGRFGALTAAERPAKLGWMLFDYAFVAYPTYPYGRYGHVTLVDFLIASNFGYGRYSKTFTVDRPLSGPLG